MHDFPIFPYFPQPFLFLLSVFPEIHHFSHSTLIFQWIVRNSTSWVLPSPWCPGPFPTVTLLLCGPQSRFPVHKRYTPGDWWPTGKRCCLTSTGKQMRSTSRKPNAKFKQCAFRKGEDHLSDPGAWTRTGSLFKAVLPPLNEHTQNLGRDVARNMPTHVRAQASALPSYLHNPDRLSSLSRRSFTGPLGTFMHIVPGKSSCSVVTPSLHSWFCS